MQLSALRLFPPFLMLLDYRQNNLEHFDLTNEQPTNIIKSITSLQIKQH